MEIFEGAVPRPRKSGSVMFKLALCSVTAALGAKHGVVEFDHLNFDKVVDGSRHTVVQFSEYTYGGAKDFENTPPAPLTPPGFGDPACPFLHVIHLMNLAVLIWAMYCLLYFFNNNASYTSLLPLVFVCPSLNLALNLAHLWSAHPSPHRWYRFVNKAWWNKWVAINRVNAGKGAARAHNSYQILCPREYAHRPPVLSGPCDASMAHAILAPSGLTPDLAVSSPAGLSLAGWPTEIPGHLISANAL
eukprot:gene3347-3844_t